MSNVKSGIESFYTLLLKLFLDITFELIFHNVQKFSNEAFSRFG